MCVRLTARILLKLRSLMFDPKPDNGSLPFNLTFMPNSEKPVWSFLISKCSKLSLLSGFFYYIFVVNGTCGNLCSFLWWWIGWKGKNCLINEYPFWLCQGKCGITMYRRQVHNTLKIADFFLNWSWSLVFTLSFQGFWKMGLIISPPVVGEFDFLFRFLKNPTNLCVSNLIGLLPKEVNNKHKYT